MSTENLLFLIAEALRERDFNIRLTAGPGSTLIQHTAHHNSVANAKFVDDVRALLARTGHNPGGDL